jgi:quaternary ammonium compound-resistance protein SugE
MAWIYLLIASCFEVAWIYSVKLLSMNKIFKIQWAQFFDSREPFYTLAPLLGYVVFGLCNIYFFSTAMKSIPASVAFAIWTGITLIFAKIVDTVFFKEAISPVQLLCFAMIIGGIIGLRMKAV